MGSDFDTFANGLRAALRQPPKLILVVKYGQRNCPGGFKGCRNGASGIEYTSYNRCRTTVNRFDRTFEAGEEKKPVYGLPIAFVG